MKGGVCYFISLILFLALCNVSAWGGSRGIAKAHIRVAEILNFLKLVGGCGGKLNLGLM